MTTGQGDFFEELRLFRDDVGKALRGMPSLEGAAQLFVDRLFGWRACDELVLARLYATLPFGELPPEARASLAARSGAAVGDESLVLTLLGSQGVDPLWRSRHTSRNHAFLPLLSASAIRKAPMLARMLAELGVDLHAFDAGGGRHRLLLGGVNGVFYVGDAASERDELGRLVIPDGDFVAKHRVRCVWGLGGLYPNGLVAVCIVFTRRDMPRSHAERQASLITTFKLATSSLADPDRWFSCPP